MEIKKQLHKNGCPKGSTLSHDKKYCILKQPLYHGTQCKHKESILMNGLYIGQPVHRETDDYNPQMSKEDGSRSRGAKMGVYLTRDIDGAAIYALDASKDVPSEWMDILEEFDSEPENACIVTIHKIPVGTQIVPDGYGDIMTKNKTIPPECIQSIDSLKELVEKGVDLSPDISYYL